MTAGKKFNEIWNSEKKSRSFMVYNSANISVIAVDTEDDAKFMTDYMSRYHGETYTYRPQN